MALNPVTLASEIAKGMGYPPPVTPQLIGWAAAIVSEIASNGKATQGGIAGPHPISGINGPSLAKKIAAQAGYPKVTRELQKYSDAIASYINKKGKVTYKGPPPSSGNPDWFEGGKISGMLGTDLAEQIAKATGYGRTTKELRAKSNALVRHIQKNATVLNGSIS